MTDGTNPVIVPHEFTGPDTGGGRICRYCAGTPLECAHVFGPHCPQAAEAQAALAAPPANPVIVERVRKLAAEIMVAVRQARFPKEYPAEAHDEFEALTLAPMLQAALEAMPDVRELVVRMKAITDAHAAWCDTDTGTNAEMHACARLNRAVGHGLAALAKVSGVSK